MQISYAEEIKRKLVHLSSLWMVAATLLLARWQYLAAAIFGALLLLTLISGIIPSRSAAKKDPVVALRSE